MVIFDIQDKRGKRKTANCQIVLYNCDEQPCLQKWSDENEFSI